MDIVGVVADVIAADCVVSWVVDVAIVAAVAAVAAASISLTNPNDGCSPNMTSSSHARMVDGLRLSTRHGALTFLTTIRNKFLATLSIITRERTRHPFPDPKTVPEPSIPPHM
jgi:hypothetical protein